MGHVGDLPGDDEDGVGGEVGPSTGLGAFGHAGSCMDFLNADKTFGEFPQRMN